MIGTRIDGKYLVERCVDETASSIVFRATHVLWQRPVALKVLKAADLSREARTELLAAFVREGALLAELSESCAAICQARDVGAFTTFDGDWLPYTVLEWLDGQPLEALLTQGRAEGVRLCSITEVLALLTPVADALALAHAHGITHCDVKPGNVMVLEPSSDGRPRCKLLDFGTADTCARKARVRTSVQLRSFTPAYGAPEQFDPSYGETGPWTDVYALALIVVELLTGREALSGSTMEGLAAQACDPLRRPTPQALGIDVGDHLERILRRALDVDIRKRQPSARVFWDALAHAGGTSPETAPNIPIPLCRRRAA